MGTMWKSICLDGEWELFTAHNRDCTGETDKYTTLSSLQSSGFTHICGKVPGNFELDFQREGLLPDLFYSDHPLKARELESLHLWYGRKFRFEELDIQRRFFRFEGIDTFAEIYLNGVLVGESDNMLIAHEYPAAGLKQGDNELVVHILPVFLRSRQNCFEAGVTQYQEYQADAITVRKAPHMFGWDIMPRILSGGLWRSVYLFEKPVERIEDIFITTIRATPELATFHLYYRAHIEADCLCDYRLLISGECDDSRFFISYKPLHTEGRTFIHVKNPKLWWPKGMGDSNLYRIHIDLCCGDTVLDSRDISAGFREVELEKTDIVDEDGNGKFCFKVNGEKMFVRGVNWVPLDAFHSRDRERLPKVLSLLEDSHCNMVRCWGGNVYESDEFFDYCDRNGIAVWQDFAMACSFYPQGQEFQSAIRTEAEHIVRRLRNHTSLFLWVGDNECDVAISGWHPVRQDCNSNVLTRQVLPEVLHRMDPFRVYMASSPYISAAAFAQRKEKMVPEYHLWGPRTYYKTDFYSKAVCRFASETGYHGCPSPESLKKFLSPTHLWPWKGNREWLIHATCMEAKEDATNANRIPVMDSQVHALFGFHPEDLDVFALASQLTQAEADKYFVERFRLGKWDKTTGILIWNLIDGWPQFSDAVVDYYFNRKLAYSVLQRCQEPVCLIFREPKDGVLTLACANDTLKEARVSYRVTDVTHDKVLLDGSAQVGKNVTADIDTIVYPGEETVFFLIEWEYEGKRYKNHYINGTAPLSFERCLEGYRKSDILNLEGF